jgi:hypothetical protein
MKKEEKALFQTLWICFAGTQTMEDFINTNSLVESSNSNSYGLPSALLRQGPSRRHRRNYQKKRN